MSDDFALIRQRQKAIFGNDSPLVDNAGSSLAARLCSAYREAQGMPQCPFDMLPEPTKAIWQRVASVSQPVAILERVISHNADTDGAGPIGTGCKRSHYNQDAAAIIVDLGKLLKGVLGVTVVEWVRKRDADLADRMERFFTSSLGSKS